MVVVIGRGYETGFPQSLKVLQFNNTIFKDLKQVLDSNLGPRQWLGLELQDVLCKWSWVHVW